MWKRIKNLWALSEFEPRKLGDTPVPPQTQVAQLIKKPAQFIPRIKVNPAKEIIEEPQ